jgi:SnoaL-like domain
MLTRSMSHDITLPELQEFIAGFWYHYDEAHYDELAASYAEDAHYLTRSDSGASPFEDLMSPELHGRDAVMEWLSDHRKQSPYPLRHHATNVHRTGTEGDLTRARFYILVNQIANFVPFAVSSGVVNVGVRRDATGLVFTEMDVVLDATNSVLLSELAADSAAGS